MNKDDKLDETIVNAIRTRNPETDCMSLNINSQMYYDIIHWLEMLMDDTENGWIDYYVYETNCGTLFGDDAVTDENGQPIPFKTVDDLYNVLINNINKKK